MKGIHLQKTNMGIKGIHHEKNSMGIKDTGKYSPSIVKDTGKYSPNMKIKDIVHPSRHSDNQNDDLKRYPATQRYHVQYRSTSPNRVRHENKQ